MGIETLDKFVENDLTDPILLEAAEGRKFGGIVGGIFGEKRVSTQSASPGIWNEYFRRAEFGKPLGFYHAFDLPDTPTSFEEFMEEALAQDIFEFSVTNPYKERCLTLLESVGAEIDETARILGNANHIIKGADGKIYGMNTDKFGFIEMVKPVDFPAQDVLLVGAGSTATTAAHGLAEQGVRTLRIANRTQSTARELVQKLRQRHPNLNVGYNRLDAVQGVAETASMIVQAVPVGGLVYEDVRRTRPDVYIVDVNYGEGAKLPDIAKTHGRKHVDGRGMVFWQFVPAVEKVMRKTFETRPSKFDIADMARERFG